MNKHVSIDLIALNLTSQSQVLRSKVKNQFYIVHYLLRRETRKEFLTGNQLQNKSISLHICMQLVQNTAFIFFSQVATFKGTHLAKRLSNITVFCTCSFGCHDIIMLDIYVYYPIFERELFYLFIVTYFTHLQMVGIA